MAGLGSARFQLGEAALLLDRFSSAGGRPPAATNNGTRLLSPARTADVR